MRSSPKLTKILKDYQIGEKTDTLCIRATGCVVGPKNTKRLKDGKAYNELIRIGYSYDQGHLRHPVDIELIEYKKSNNDIPPGLIDKIIRGGNYSHLLSLKATEILQ